VEQVADLAAEVAGLRKLNAELFEAARAARAVPDAGENARKVAEVFRQSTEVFLAYLKPIPGSEERTVTAEVRPYYPTQADVEAIDAALKKR